MRFKFRFSLDCAATNTVISPIADVEILWKATVSAKFRANHSKLCGNYVFPQNFHTRKLGEITVFFAVLYVKVIDFIRLMEWIL